MTQVHRIRGVAGAGKTTRMMELVNSLVGEGYSANDFRFVSFSRSHATDLENDVLDAWSDRVKQLDDDEAESVEEILMANVSTLHSLCSRLMHTEDIITPGTDGEVYKEFWQSKGFEFDVDDEDVLFVDSDNVDVEEKSRVEKILLVDQLLAQVGAGLDGEGADLAPASLRLIPVEIDLHASCIIDLVREWREWKQENGIDEHHDYILDAANSSCVPDCRVLVVDEMQDYSPLEYVVVRDWIRSGKLDHAVLAGDEHQSIYGFKLADPSYFTERDVDEEEVLTESYRCPRAVCDVARSVCPETGITSARDDEGSVYEVSIESPEKLGLLVRRLLEDHPPEPYEADPTSVFLLTRTNRQASKVGWGLRKVGIPYDSTKEAEQTPWTDDVLDAVEALRMVSSGANAVPSDFSDALIDLAPNSEERREMASSPDLGGLDAAGSAVNIWTAFPGCSSARDIVQTLDVKEYVGEMIRGAMQSEVDLTPGLVEVGTIHSAKGREAPAVVVFDGYPHRLRAEYDADPEFADEENRVAYVAATRASQTLAIGRDYLGGAGFPPFAPSTISQGQSDKGVIEQ